MPSTISSRGQRQLSPGRYDVVQYTLESPALSEIASVIQQALLKNYAVAEVVVGACPNLTEAPFGLTRPGLCGGQQAILDVGGPPYLLPTPSPDKHRYDFIALAEQLKLYGHAMIGAGAGPYFQLGCNSELVADVFMPEENSSTLLQNESRYVVVDTKPGETKDAVPNHSVHKLGELKQQPHTEFVLLGNFYASHGDAGDVLCMRAKKRIGSQADFTTCIREALHHHYGERVVALGGVFAMREGKARMHVMPDFSKNPITNDNELNSWLQFFTVSAPFMCVSEIVSRDPGLDLRVQHAHGYGARGGGHYHHDVTPEDVEYEAYYNVAHVIYRIDRPATDDAGQFGRD